MIAAVFFPRLTIDNVSPNSASRRDFVQDNHSFSSVPGVVRGLHFQVTSLCPGEARAGDTRGQFSTSPWTFVAGSPTYGRHVSATLSAENWAQIWIPEGFAHGFCTLEPNTVVLYKTTAYYAPEFSRGIKWDDPALGIAWPVDPNDAVLSDADKSYPPLAALPEISIMSNVLDGVSSEIKFRITISCRTRGSRETSTAPAAGILPSGKSRTSREAALRDVLEGLRRWELWVTMGWYDVRQHYRRSVLGPFG